MDFRLHLESCPPSVDGHTSNKRNETGGQNHADDEHPGGVAILYERRQAKHLQVLGLQHQSCVKSQRGK